MLNQNRTYRFNVAGKEFFTGTHIMAIMNITPDSFFEPSRACDNVVEKARELVSKGADLIDIGGQSTRPNSRRLGALEELSRVLPAVMAVRSEFPDIPISVDTFFPNVAEKVLQVGANMINDVSCLSSKGMAEIIAQYGAAVCVMHDRRNSKIPDLMIDKELGLRAATEKLLRVGVKEDKILLDGGIGFNKSKEEDWELLNRYDELIDSLPKFPFLLGTSRKSMFGGEVEDRLSATLDSTRLAIKQGVLFVRVHDIAENRAVLDAR